MAQFPLSDLLSGLRRLFVGLHAKKADGTYTDVKITDNGEVYTSIVAGNNVIGKVIVSDGTNLVALTPAGSIKILPTNTAGTELFTTTNPAKVIAAGSGIFQGAKQIAATAGTQIQLPNNACNKVTIIALKDNTGSIFVGGSNVSSAVYGVELQASDSITLEVSNTNFIYLVANVAGEGISYFIV